MPTYIIKNAAGQPINTIVADESFVKAAYPGKYEAMPDSPASAPAPAAASTPTQITRLEFRNRFTLSEKALLELAALDDPTAQDKQRQQAAMLRAYLKDLDAASFVDVTDPTTMAGVQTLEQMGLLAAGRAAEILRTDTGGTGKGV